MSFNQIFFFLYFLLRNMEQDLSYSFIEAYSLLRILFSLTKGTVYGCFKKYSQIICKLSFMSIVIYLLSSFLYCVYQGQPWFILLMRKICIKIPFLCTGGDRRLIIFFLHSQSTQTPDFKIIYSFPTSNLILNRIDFILIFFLFFPHFPLPLSLSQLRPSDFIP